MGRTGLRSRVDACRRWLTLTGLRGGQALAGLLGPGGGSRLGGLLGRAAGQTPLRRMLASNLRAAGVEPAADVLDGYFRHLGHYLGWAAAVYNCGFADSGIADRVVFDQSVRHLDQTHALGRGVVLVSPHEFCHEIGIAAINRRHPVTLVVRESANPIREKMKAKWYRATGLNTLYRSRASSLLADTVAYLRALRKGQCLGVTPDVICPAKAGLHVRMFGLPVVLSPGCVVLAMHTGAPIVPVWWRWVEGRAPAEDRLEAAFDEPIEVPRTGDRDAVVRATFEEWCCRFEAHFRRMPQNWMFWLDKSWSMVLRQAA